MAVLACSIPRCHGGMGRRLVLLATPRTTGMCAVPGRQRHPVCVVVTERPPGPSLMGPSPTMGLCDRSAPVSISDATMIGVAVIHAGVRVVIAIVWRAAAAKQ
jgi:hypothetical protein